jgi:DNA-binding CsgD family transcriptional regulator
MSERPLSLVTPGDPVPGSRAPASAEHRHLLSHAADALSTGVLLFDASAAVVAANASARGLLRAAGQAVVPPPSGRHGDPGRIRLADAVLQTRIESSVRTIAARAADEDRRAQATAVFAIGDVGGGRPRLSLRLSAVAPADVPAPRVARTTTVLGLLVDHGRASGPDPRLLHDLFDLGEASARVAVACLRADSVKEVARTLGISVNTVKTHLLSVYVKTGCRRRTQLVRLLSTLDAARAHAGLDPER